MQRSREIKNAKYRVNQAMREVEIKRRELLLAERLEMLEHGCLQELRQTPDDTPVLEVNAVVRKWRNKKSELRTR